MTSLHCTLTFAINVLLPISSMAGDYQSTDFVFLVLCASLIGERKARGGLAGFSTIKS